MSSTDSLAAFLGACGANAPLQLEVEDSRTGKVERRAFDQPFVVVGRDARADLPLADPDVSRRHAYLQVLAGRVFVVDLLSRTGTYWGDDPHTSGWLDGARAVGIGPYHLRAPDGAPAGDWDPLAPSPPDQDRGPCLILETVGPNARHVTWRMNRALALVGQSDECKVRVRDEAVSRFAWSLVRTPEGVWAVDLLGRAGLLVNEVPARWVLLRDGDCLRVGSVSFVVRYATPAAAGAPQAEAPHPPGPEDSGILSNGVPALPLPAPGALQSTLFTSPLPPARVFGGALTPGTQGVGLPAGVPADGDAVALLAPLVGQFAQMQQQMVEQFTQALLMMGQMFGQLQREQLGLIREELARLRQVGQELAAVQAEVAQHRPGPAPARPAPRPETKPPEVAPAPANAPKAAGVAANSAAASDAEVHAQLCQRLHQLQQEHQGRWQRLVGLLTGKGSGTPSP